MQENSVRDNLKKFRKENHPQAPQLISMAKRLDVLAQIAQERMLRPAEVQELNGLARDKITLEEQIFFG